MSTKSPTRELYAGLKERRTPEQVGPIVRDLLGLDAHEWARFPKARHASSSMSDRWHGAAPIDRPVKSLAAILGVPAPDGSDVEGVLVLVARARVYLHMAMSGTSFKHDRMNRAQRHVAGIGDLSRRRYDKVFRLVGRIEARVGSYQRNVEMDELARFAKIGFVAEVPWTLFRRSPSSASFAAYYAANAGRRSLFTVGSQKRAMDAALKVILDRCEADPRTSWPAVAYAFPREDVLARVPIGERVELLDVAFRKLVRISELLQACVTPTMDLQDMVVKAGDDSSTWNALAGAWNKARDLWLSVAWSVDPTIADALLPGKVLRLMAYDVVRWHRASGGGLEPDTLVWRDLPRPWEVMSGQRSCTRELVVASCILNKVDPAKGWAKPRPRTSVEEVSATPETVHGVVISHPQLAAILRKAGWFSGYEKRVREVAPVIADAGVDERAAHLATEGRYPIAAPALQSEEDW